MKLNVFVQQLINVMNYDVSFFLIWIIQRVYKHVDTARPTFHLFSLSLHLQISIHYINHDNSIFHHSAEPWPNYIKLIVRIEEMMSVKEHFVRTCFYLNHIDLLQHVRKKIIIVDGKLFILLFTLVTYAYKSIATRKKRIFCLSHL